MDGPESALPARVWVELHYLGCQPSPDEPWCDVCALPSVLDVMWAYADQATLRVIGHQWTRWCPSCGRCWPVRIRGSG